MLVYNISGKTVTDVSFKQTYPDGVSVKETYQRDIGTEATGEQSSAPQGGREQLLREHPDLETPPVRGDLQRAADGAAAQPDHLSRDCISYTDTDGQRKTTKLQDNTYDLFIYSNVVGGLERFLKKYNNIAFDFAKATPNRKEWEFAPIAASAKGRFPTGVIGTYPGEDQYNGYFRIRSGPPGDSIQMMVVYKQTEKKDCVADQETVLKNLRDYLRWCGEFEFIPDGLKVEQGKWKGYADAWSVTGRWRDTLKNRLGEGPVEAHVFYGAHEDVEYYVIGASHGRALGEASVNPNPDKESQLAGEVHALIDTFRSNIVPLANDRRHYKPARVIARAAAARVLSSPFFWNP